jgi:hypothetical protein
VVLDDVLGDARLLVELAPTLDADLLGHGDLHVVDVLAVPERLEHAVGEAKDEQVLNRLLAEVVIDAEHLRFTEDLGDGVVELARAVEVAPERLLDDHARPEPVTAGPIGRMS